MGLIVIGETLKTGDQTATPPTFFHRFTPTIWLELKVAQTWGVKYNAPTSDPIGLALYSYNSVNGSRELIATAATTWQVSEISSDNYGLKQLYFEFTNAPTLRPGTEYAISLLLPNYTGDDDNHIAWVRSWPDHIVDFAGSDQFRALNRFPFQVGFIGREVRP